MRVIIITKYDIDTESENLTFKNNAQGAQNYDFENSANGIIDFSETNPFGEIGYGPNPAPFVITSYNADSDSLFGDSITITTDTE